MTNGELKEYLNTFPDDVNISVILANPKERKLYEVVNAFGITDAPNPTFCIEVGQAKDMDADIKSIKLTLEKLGLSKQIVLFTSKNLDILYGYRDT